MAELVDRRAALREDLASVEVELLSGPDCRALAEALGRTEKALAAAHFGRHIPAHLRTALDLGAPPGFEGAVCATPGCGRGFGLEYDHVEPVANGGATSYANLEPRCAPCHWQRTEADRRAGRLGRSRPGRGRARRTTASAASAGGGGPGPP